LDDESLAQHWAVLKDEPGAVIVSYASVMRRILDYLEDNQIDGRDAKLRAIILTSEPVDQEDIIRVSRILGAPAAIEYGMAETGVLAYTRPGSTILHFFWDSFQCHVTPERELVVSTLNDLRFPLINYGTGDLVEGIESEVPFSCRAIRGRTNDHLLLTMCDGSDVEVHSELLTHVIKTEPTVRSFFIYQKGRQIDVSLRLSAGSDFATVVGNLLHELAIEFPDLNPGYLRFGSLNQDVRTIAGKQRFVVREG
jgi:phenylacetate-coenzyme A ligase PaaK-like adenylate-forming protein